MCVISVTQQEEYDDLSLHAYPGLNYPQMDSIQNVLILGNVQQIWE